MNNKKLYIMRGLPGSGKSTKAKELSGNSGQVFSTDDYFSMSGEYNWFANLLGKAHKWNSRRCKYAIESGISPVVIDNTNVTMKDLRSLRDVIELARECGYDVEIAEPNTEWRFDVNELDKRNTHNVPREVIERKVNEYVHDVTVEDIMSGEDKV